MVCNLLNDDQKQQHIEVCSEFVAAIHRHSLAMLDLIMTMDEMMVCYHPLRQKSSHSSGLRGVSRA